MRKILSATAFAVLLGVMPVMAQGSVNRSGAATGPGTNKAAPDARAAGGAPVGHRQPTASDVRANDPYGKSAEDKDLDRKIGGICRGC